ncbi:MAG TPA: GTPase domain-containing protein [Thermomicrobiales bacterium]|nr:GTPase domain-containing protein [Thermomicrobiales bacterium]
MATINVAKRRIDTKIVYYGPGLSGKTTNLVNVHSRMPDELRGPMRSIDTEQERTLFFDFIPVEPVEVGGWAIRFHLYTVPGQRDYVRTRRAILGGADGVVFVADAEPEQADPNRESLAELHEHLAHYGRDDDSLPIVLQINKTDLAGGRPVAEVNDDLNAAGWPMFPAMAIRGIGVAETLGAVAKLVARTL